MQEEQGSEGSVLTTSIRCTPTPGRRQEAVWLWGPFQNPPAHTHPHSLGRQEPAQDPSASRSQQAGEPSSLSYQRLGAVTNLP